MPFTTEANKMTNGRYGWALAVCDRCADSRYIAVGFIYDQLTIREKVQCAIKMGWKTAPRLLCPRCVHHPEIPIGRE